MITNPPTRECDDGAGFQSVDVDAGVEVGPPQPQGFQRSVGRDPDPAYGTLRALLSALRNTGVDALRRRRG